MSKPDVNRRTMLKLIGAAAAAQACGEAPATDGGVTDPGPLPEGDPRNLAPDSPWVGFDDAIPAPDLYTIGVSSGDPLPDGAILISRYLGEAKLDLVWSAFVDGAWTELSREPIVPDVDGFIHLDFVGLGPDTWHAFQFVDAEDMASPVGHFVTAIAEDSTSVVHFGATSCAAQSHEAFPSLTHVLERGPLDAFFLLGDTVYCDGLPINVDAYRNLWAQNLTAPGFSEIRRGTATICTWDDHEITNNWDAENINPLRRDVGTQAFFENSPVRADAPDRIWRTLRYGRTAEVFVLDCRGERRPSKGEYLSRAQLNWLKKGLAESTATWKLICNSVPAANIENGFWDVAIADRWEGFAEQRTELLQHLVDNDVSGVLFVSGDVHVPWVCHLDRKEPFRRFLEVSCGPAGSFLNILGSLIYDDDQFRWVQARWNSTRLSFDYRGTASVVWVGEDNQDIASCTLTAEGEILDVVMLEPIDD